MNKDPIINSISNSCRKAFHEYQEMTEGDAWVSWTPEYWYTTYIAKGIRDGQLGYSVWLEHNLNVFQNSAIYGGTNQDVHWDTLERADVTLWKKHKQEKWEAISIIEVKKAWSCNKEKLIGDVERISNSLMNTSVKSGYFIIVTDAENGSKKSAQSKITDFCKRLETKIPNYIGEDSSSLNINLYQNQIAKIKKDNSIASTIVMKFTRKNNK